MAVEVCPIGQSDGLPYFLVLFEAKLSAPDGPPAHAPARPSAKERGARRPADARVVQLENELETTRDHLQSMIHDLEAANEELQGRNEERVRANSDLVNLLGSVHDAIVIVSNDLRIRRFTPIAEHVLNLTASDVGRPIGHIKPNIDCPDLESLIVEVVERVTPYEREVRDRQGAWYSMRIRPYKNLENRVDGAVIALVDVSVPRLRGAQIQDARMLEEALLDLIERPTVVLDESLRVRAANRE